MPKPKKPAVRTAIISVRVLPQVKDGIERVAEDQHRTLSNVVELALLEFLKRNGYLKD